MKLNTRLQKLRYEILAGKISDKINEGSLLPGDKLPSVRRLSTQEKVSVSTVLAAYELLEKKGFILARPQSGYFVKKMREPMPEPKTHHLPSTASFVNIENTVSEILSGVNTENIVPFGAALPSAELLPINALNKITGELCRRSDNAPLKYESPTGSIKLRRQLSRYAADWGCHLSPSDFIITGGCTEALSLSLRAAVRHGGTVAVESPAYYGVLMTIAGLGLKTLELPTHPRDGVILSELEKHLKNGSIDACLLAPNFNNPLGSLMSDENKQKLYGLLKRYDKPFIEDDIYGDLYFTKSRPLTVKSFDKKGIVLLCSSFTKSIAPGYRIGYTSAGRYKGQLEKLKFMNTGSTNTMGQLIIAEYLSRGGYDRHLHKLRKILLEQIQIAQELINRYFPAGTRVSRPQGGLVLWIELSTGTDTFALYKRALNKNISFIPGHIFSNTKNYRHCLRISCGTLWSEKNRAAFANLGELAKELSK
ncbi:MAG: PLP-dependent aminotransferase family protein [Spirochaetia bacterium]|nr:PLP-dependent aminotransferase family protein [Spirochaetia bacterium]